MTVMELIAYLETLPETTRVFEDNRSELRELKFADLSYDEAAEGNPIDENEYDAEEWEALMSTPIVIMRAWS